MCVCVCVCVCVCMMYVCEKLQNYLRNILVYDNKT